MKVSPAAQAKIQCMINQPDQMLRISIHSGGCSGFEKIMDLDCDVHEDDVVVDRCVVVDSISWQFVQDSVLDWHSSIAGEKFELSIQNSSANCGCGRSFGI